MIDSRDISVVFQGELPVAPSERQAMTRTVAHLRRLLPGAPLLLGTWEGGIADDERLFDRVVLAGDPGVLPAFKYGAANVVNNVNRQIVGVSSVLCEVTTPYLLKLRLDSEVHHLGFLAEYARHGRNAAGGERLVVPGFFTLDPRMFERMPYHISDWFAFGPSTKMRTMWNVPLMQADMATYYDRIPHAAHSTWFDRRYRAQFAIEQYIACHYAHGLGYQVPAFHNDSRPAVLAGHDRFVANELLVLDQGRFGLSSRKYGQVVRSSLQYFNCLGFLDWYLLQVEAEAGFVPDPVILSQANRRARAKRLMRAAGALADPMMPLVRQPLVKACISRTLRAALRLA